MGNLTDKCSDKNGTDWIACQGEGSQDGFRTLYVTNSVPKAAEDDYMNFLIACNSGPGGQDPDNHLICLDQTTIGGIDFSGQALRVAIQPPSSFGVVGSYGAFGAGAGTIDASQFNSLLICTYFATAARLQRLCGSVDWNEIWPAFYWNYNSTLGKKNVEALIQKYPTLPQEAQDALRNNTDARIQQLYCLINRPKTVFEGDSLNTSLKWGLDLYNPGKAFVGYHDITGEDFFGYQAGQFLDEYYFPRIDSLYNVNFFFPVETIHDSHFETNQVYGNPFWSHTDLATALEHVVGSDFSGKLWWQVWAQSYLDAGFINPGKTATDYIDPLAHAGTVSQIQNPEYSGNLPYAPPYATQGAEPYHLATSDNKAYGGYTDPCFSQPLIDEVLPYVVGGIGGAFGALVIPGAEAKALGASTLALSGYYLTSSVVGYRALQLWGEGLDSGKNLTGEILSTGIPMTAAALAFELGVFPNDTVTNLTGLTVAGLAGFFFLSPVVTPIVTDAATVLQVLQAPLAIVEKFVQSIFNGCLAHNDPFTYHCDCESAATKPLLSKALLVDVFGVTGAQLQLRKTALKAAMTTNSWGTDPIDIGECNSQGHADPMACISPGEWAFQTWPKDFDAQATVRWNDIKHVFDPGNKSFLPPVDTDKPCLTYGPHFRMQGGKCLDTTAPPNMQGPGAYTWPTASNEECTIL